MSIPKTIHQTITNKKLLSNSLLENIENIKLKNSSFIHKIYDDEERGQFILKHYGDKFFKIYSSINPAYGAARADYFRYLAIYKVGGIYLDIKSTTLKPLDNFIYQDDRIILSHWKKHTNNAQWEHVKFGIKYEWQQHFVISEPEHPYLKNVIDLVTENILNYNPFIHKTGKVAVLATTGPIAYTHGINADFCHQKHRVICSEDEGLLFSIFPSNQHSKHIGNYRYLTTPLILNNLATNKLFNIYSIPKNIKRFLSK